MLHYLLLILGHCSLHLFVELGVELLLEQPEYLINLPFQGLHALPHLLSPPIVIPH